MTSISETSFQARIFRAISQYLVLLVLLIMLGHTLIYLAYGVALIPFPYDYDQAEGFELNIAILLARGDCPYCDNNTYPFFASGYPPLFHILMIPFVWLFGPAFWYGRLLIFLSTWVTMGAIAYAVFRTGRHLRIALIAGLAFLASNYIYHIGPLLRQHLLMVMFETLAMVLAVNAFDKPDVLRRKQLIGAFAFLLLAGYTKQLAVSTCVALFAWGFLRNPRTIMVYSTGFALVGGTLFALAMALTNGEWWANIIISNQNPYITEQFTGLLAQFIRLHWPLLILAGLYILYECYAERLSLYSVWFICSAISTIGAGKWGAGDSYFATTLVAACILAGLFISRHLKSEWHWPQVIAKNWGNVLSRTSAVLGIILLGIYGLTVIKFPTSGPIFGPLAEALNIRPTADWRYPLYDSAGWTVGYAVTGHFTTNEDSLAGDYILQQVLSTEKDIITEDAGFAILAGKEVVTNPIQLNNLWENNRYDPAPLISMIEAGDFGLIIMRARFFPPPVLMAIQSHYRLDETIEMNGFAYELWVWNEG